MSNILDSSGVPFGSNYAQSLNYISTHHNVGGVSVNSTTAYQHSIVYACIRVLAESVGQLPVNLFEIGDDGSRTKTRNHQQLKVLTQAPNDYQTWQEMLELIVTHINLYGNFYAFVNRRKSNGKTRIVEIIPIPNPESVIVKMMRGQVSFEITDSALIDLPKRIFSSNEILHIKGASTDGLIGISPISQASRSIGLSIAAERHAEEFYNNSATPNGILTTDQQLSPEASKRLQDGFNEIHQGIKNSNKLAVLEGGLKYQGITVSNKDSQFMETRAFQKNEICALFRVPTQMVQAGDSKYSNFEQAILSFHRDTLIPLISRITNKINTLLDDDLEIQLDDTYILRGDSKTQSEVNTAYFNLGALSINELRNRIGEASIEGGDVRVVDSNNHTLGDISKIDELQQEQLQLEPTTNGDVTDDNQT